MPYPIPGPDYVVERVAALPQVTIRAITQTQDGYLWIGTYNGLIRFDGLNFRQFEQANPSALSGGMRQRAALMRTLVVEPQVLLMDEPFGALDTHTKIDMHEVLLRIWDREQQTVLFVTHDLGEALTLADRIILFSARPGQVKDIFEVDIARPRDAVKVRETPRYAELFQHIWHSLGEEFVKGRSP